MESSNPKRRDAYSHLWGQFAAVRFGAATGKGSGEMVQRWPHEKFRLR